MNKISEVIELALFIHNDQLDKAGVDYILHPLHIMQQVKDYGEGHMVVAILHDALEGFEGEDYEENLYSIRDLCTNDECDAILAITRGKRESWKNYLIRVKQNEIARVVKIKDLLHNSDMSRLPAITIEDTKRTKKYLNAIDFLKQPEQPQQ